MTDLLHELTQARYQAAGGATDKAQGHIAEALELLNDALAGRPGPKPSVRSIRAYLDEAQFAIKSGNSKLAVAAFNQPSLVLASSMSQQCRSEAPFATPVGKRGSSHISGDGFLWPAPCSNWLSLSPEVPPMELSPYGLALIAGGFTVLGTLIGAVITYWLAWDLAQKTARQEAGRKLREAFEPELAALDPITGEKTINVEALLRSAWPRHRAAISELMFHLPLRKRAELEIAWRDYYEVGGSIRFFDYYLTASGQTGTPHDRFKQKVEAILSFTNV